MMQIFKIIIGALQLLYVILSHNFSVLCPKLHTVFSMFCHGQLITSFEAILLYYMTTLLKYCNVG